MQQAASIKILNTVAAVLLGIAWFTGKPLFAYISFGLILVTLISPLLTHWLATAWMKLGEALGWVNSKIILSLIFFLILTPLAFFYRLRTGDRLQLKRKPEGSYFKIRDHKYEPRDLEKMW